MLPGILVHLEHKRGWPRLMDTEICLLAKLKLELATRALAAFIRSRISYNQTC